MNDLEYTRELNRIVDEIFEEACEVEDWSWPELADKAGLAHSTVYRLGDRVTKRPQLRTVLCLAKAVGFKVTFVKARINRWSA